MQNADDKNISKPAMLAQLIYKAIVRYIKANKSPISMKNTKLSLDYNRVWRGNVQELVDDLEKKHK